MKPGKNGIKTERAEKINVLQITKENVLKIIILTWI